jgi:hypothetical protein
VGSAPGETSIPRRSRFAYHAWLRERSMNPGEPVGHHPATSRRLSGAVLQASSETTTVRVQQRGAG